MKCPCCESCEPNPDPRLAEMGYCFFMGPYDGFMEAREIPERDIARKYYGVGHPGDYRTKPDAETIREVQEWATSLE